MNCKDTQAAIDSASRRNPVSQPVSAHMAGCPDCRRYSDQSGALLALLSIQPRVEVPADFDFKLRARIARAESQPSSPFAFLGNFFGQSFSIKQAATSLAALAVMAAATTFYFTGSNQSVSPTANNTAIARVETPAQETPKVMMAPAETAATVTPELPKALVRAVSNARANTARIRPAVFNDSPAKDLSIARNVANKEEMIRVFNGKRGQVFETSVRPTLIGAEGSVAMAKPAAYSAF